MHQGRFAALLICQVAYNKPLRFGLPPTFRSVTNAPSWK